MADGQHMFHDDSLPVPPKPVEGGDQVLVKNSNIAICIKHMGDGDGCEVCSASAQLVASAKVASSPGETAMEMEGNNSPPQDEGVCSSDNAIEMASSPPDPPVTLKKDDSGICVRESLTSDDSKCEEDDGGKSDVRPPRHSISSEGVVTDILDMEESEANNPVPDSSAPGGSQANPNSHTSEVFPCMADHNSESSDGNVVVQRVRRRRRAHTRSSSSSSDSSDSSDSSITSGPDDPASDLDNDEDKPEMQVDMSTMPLDPWRVLLELRQRENGFCTQMPADRLFRQRVGASLKFVQRLELQHKLEHHEGCVNALNFNKSGTLLASGSDDLNVVIWNWSEKKPYLVFDSGHKSNVFQCKFMPYSGDTHIVTCARDGYVRLAELSSTGVCKGTKKLALHRSASHKLALLQDSSHVFYSCGEDALVYEIDLRQDKPTKLSVTKENDKKVALYSIHSNPSRSYEYCVGGRDHFIRIYDKRMINENSNNGILKKYCPHHLVGQVDIKANVTCAVFNSNGTEVLGTYNDEDIYLFDTSHSDGAEYIHRYTGHRNNSTVKGVNFYGPHSEYIISGSDCSNVFLWEKESEKIVQYFHADDGGVVNVLEPHPHAPILATSGLDSDVKVWAPTAQEPTVLKGLKSVTRQNERERTSERSSEPEIIDSQMLWFLMQHLRRSARRQAQQEEEEAASSSSDSDAASDDSDNPPEPVQCVPQ